MIVSACVRFHTIEYNRIPWDDSTKIGSTMYDIPCHRHADAFYIISQFFDASMIDKTKTEQGFLTQDGTFLNRYDAMNEAIASNQLPPSAREACVELYSEDLW